MKRPALAGLLALGTSLLHGQPGFSPQEGEYSLTRGLVGDQVLPALSLSAQGGYLVWQDASIDAAGLGIAARKLNNSLSPEVARTFRVNETTEGDQENAQVQLLPDGGAVFVWQGGPQGDQDIYARILGPDGVFRTGEFRVNSTSADHQSDPRVALLKDGNLVVVWTSIGQDGSMKGVYGQRLAPDGSKIGPEFRVNDFTEFNQRSPAVAGLPDGDFVVVWVTEQQRFLNSVDLMARRFHADGTPVSGEALVNNNTNVCANPVIAAAPNGDFVIAWSSLATGNLYEYWDVLVKAYAPDGTPRGNPVRVNEFIPGPQFGPSLAVQDGVVLVTWTSTFQDGSREGVYGRLMSTRGEPLGGEFRVNTLTTSRQIQPVAAADGAGRFLVAWSSYVGGPASFEILAQRYAGGSVVPRPAPPFVAALDSYTLQVSWPELAGFEGDIQYEVYVDGSGTPLTTRNGFVRLENLAPGSSHQVRLAYVVDGRPSELSDAATGTTWGRDYNFDGLPDDWQKLHWGDNPKDWPAPTADVDGDGARNVDEFLAGTDPTDTASVLRVNIAPTDQGILLSWPAVVGSVYQLQVSTNLTQWADLDSPRFAPQPEIHLVAPPAAAASYYRVIRIR
ncbi:MAG: fibronectin type III domain-containing protein [Verrucomicrobia bacterium]|nr:MAG: fibronectin type III domain-containing protein [Verrucomicrobiota bacterium]